MRSWVAAETPAVLTEVALRSAVRVEMRSTAVLTGGCSYALDLRAIQLLEYYLSINRLDS